MTDKQDLIQKLKLLIKREAGYQQFTFAELARLLRDLADEYTENIEHKMELE